MNIIKKLKSKPKMVLAAGALLFGLTLTPATSFAGNDHHEGRRNGESHQVYKNQRNYHAEDNRVRHHVKYKQSHYNKHRNRHYNKPHYVVINNYRSKPSGLRIGLHSVNFDVVFRD